jgi:oligosaccharyltransferase complex subunit epsilon
MPPKASSTASTTSKGSTTASAVKSSPNAISSLWKAYLDETPARLKLIDAFLFFLMLSGAIQFVYCVLISNFPYNAFLAG